MKTQILPLTALSFLAAAAWAVLSPALHAETSTLLDETFANGSYGTGNAGATVWQDKTVGSSGYASVWTWSAVNGLSGNAPTAQETYNGTSGNMSARGMSVLPGGAGGFEVISDPNPIGANGKGPGTWMVDTKVQVPSYFGSLQSAAISFDYGYRGSVNTGTFSLYDVTSGSYLINPTDLTSTHTGIWSTASFLLSGSELPRPNDVVDLQWRSTTSSSANSLEIGGPVTFSITTAPGAPAPPMTACLAFAGVLLLQAVRSRRAA